MNKTNLEKSIISDLVLDPYLISEVGIKSDMIQDIIYRSIFDTITDLVEQDLAIDPYLLEIKLIEKLQKTLEDKNTSDSDKVEIQNLLIDNFP